MITKVKINKEKLFSQEPPCIHVVKSPNFISQYKKLEEFYNSINGEVEIDTNKTIKGLCENCVVFYYSDNFVQENFEKLYGGKYIIAALLEID